jgi:hypothetical protein
MALSSTNLAISVGPGPSDFNNAKGEYAVGIRLSLSPTSYAEAAVYFKIFDSLGSSPTAKNPACTFT